MCLGQMRKLETGLETHPTEEPPYELMRRSICISQKVSRKKVHKGNKAQFENVHVGISAAVFQCLFILSQGSLCSLRALENKDVLVFAVCQAYKI